MPRNVLMRLVPAILLACVPAHGADFEQARAVLEVNCVECHTPEEAKGELVMSTAADMEKGGDSGAALIAGKSAESGIYSRLILAADDADRMPPKKHADPLSSEDIAILKSWIDAGADWPEGEILKPRAKTALPRWDAPADPAIVSIEAFPKEIRLETAADFHRVIVIARMKDASTHDITQQSKLSLESADFAALRENLLTPLADGETKLNIEYRGLSAAVPVTVKDAEKERPISYQLDVMPVITAAGCNTGSCHGSARGQDGFHLSLYGFDPKGDHYRLTTEMAGRRINLAVPEESLMLTKSTGKVPHTGGELFDEESPFYHTLVEWIRSGAVYDKGEIAQPTGIEIEPEQVVMTGADIRIPFTVRAKYSDGTDRDVTTLTSFSSSNDNSVKIDYHTGMAASGERGEAFLLGRFHTFTEGSQAIVVPADLEYEKPEFEAFNYIDDLVAEKLNKLRIVPSGLASDEAFMRRAYLDIIGLPPTPEDREKFLADTSPDKRDKLVDELIAREEFTEMWVMKWAELMQIRTINNGPNSVSYKAALNYHGWLRERIAANMPFNQLVNELLSASGGTFSNPATNFFQMENDTLKLTENVAQVFMGTRIQCAQCHNHPFDRWTMDDYYSFSSFFAQVKRKPAEDPRERVVFDANGEMQHPVTKQNMVPKFLGGRTPEISQGETRREVLADWLASPENPWFAANVANIFWDHFMGVGIVDPVDDVRVSNPPSNPELLDALAAKFVEYDYDFRKLVRDICTSRTYQLSTETNATNEADTRNFSKAMIRRVRAEVLLDSISQVTGTEEKYKGLPKGARAVQIADGNTSNYFLTTFGRASRATVCSCEVKMEPNLSQALHLINGDTVNQRIKQGGIVKRMLDAKQEPAAIIEALYLRALTRKPTDSEKEKLLAAVSLAGDKQQTQETLEDIFWALLNSKEFIFNH
ncbi:MAG: PSD1 and planctomycete cytochrome C domain-containing protein [Akkermansiaceae bacterium]|jgi:mono/diheme cytochrome c family protein|nr:PSD1 and planctomycete cytochrome C domain-containing protein [Akkermansiaceae bacterium]MDP4780817.1 PSD1 and planctomycete cytochrome C domain-containing protein [Akkermansiaceae bacterium]MDP4898226.1 PSD1 and planctomycete cytochrome C domain-containing protein [Akkermansiaceae bacterium]